MIEQKKFRLVRYVLFSNGVFDLFAAMALFFPLLNLPLPGYGSYNNQLKFVAGGWGIAALSFGIARIWASYKSEFYQFMVIIGLVEGVTLALYCLINVFFLEISILQAMFPLIIGSVYGVLYIVSLLALLRHD